VSVGETSESLRRPAELLASLGEVNDRIGALAPSQSAIFICEGGSQDCLGTLELDVAEYQRIRSNPLWALLVSGHELTDVERVVEESADFRVVERLLLSEPQDS
jgi:hypothetical protein